MTRIASNCIIFAIIVLAFITILNVAMEKFKQLPMISSGFGLQAKTKIFISFFQLISTFEGDVDGTQKIYGVELHEKVNDWIAFLEWFSFDISFFIRIPMECVGSMKDRLLFNVLWPLVMIAVISVGQIVCQFIVAVIMSKRNQNNFSMRASMMEAIGNFRNQRWNQILYFAIFLLYFVLPIVSNGIFEAINCQSYITNTMTDPVQSSSYLVADPEIRCEETNPEYQSLLVIFWVFFTIWPVLTPVLFLCLLLKILKSVRSKRITPMANACRFLWSDYTESMMFWDIVETIKKLFLTGFIMFVDRQEGSTKLLRLVIGKFAICLIL